MIHLMSVVMFFNGKWHARAQGCAHFAVGATPEAAMVAALTLRDGEMPNTSRCGVCGEPQIDSPSGLVCTNGHGGADTLPNADLF
ncbi:MAG: hypothetical protein E6Q97_16435 [Desulfurellales bacterium]|nr:MAG: hypothetical protein E6Q97_16435 [Desulfurellales bacterium]